MDHELCSLWEANNSLLAAQAQQPSAGPAETDGSLICQLRTQLDTAKAEQEAAKTAARVEQEKSEEVRARHDEVVSTLSLSIPLVYRKMDHIQIEHTQHFINKNLKLLTHGFDL